MTMKRRRQKQQLLVVGGVLAMIAMIAMMVSWNIYQSMFFILSHNNPLQDYPHPTTTLHHNTTNNNDNNKLPLWMKEYFHWHAQQLINIQTNITTTKTSTTPEQVWAQQRLLVMRCHENDRCGGTADRFKSLPLTLALAAQSHRLLLIDWSRPYPLEAFMRPLVMNWTVPNDLKPLLLSLRTNKTTTIRNNNINNDNNGTTTLLQKASYSGKHLQPLAQATPKSQFWLVESIIQQAGGQLYMKISHQLQQKHQQNQQQPQQIIVMDPILLYHDLFHTLFIPSPELQVVLTRMMQALQLKPNQFVVAHYRAKYPGEPYRETGNVTALEQTALHAVTCAASLTPSTTTPVLPVYVASDTLLVLQTIQNHYQNQQQQQQQQHDKDKDKKKMRVVSYLDAKKDQIGWEAQDPAHLNFAKTASAKDFFSIFVDLFVMSYAKCVTFGAGGFGRFGSLISHNVTCRKAHSIKGQLQPDC